MFARVAYSAAEGAAVAAAVAGWTAAGEALGPGLVQEDANALAAELAIRRNAVTLGLRGRVALLDKEGHYQREGFASVTRRGELALIYGAATKGEQFFPIVGDEPLVKRSSGGAPLPDDWNRRLALAIDRSLHLLKNSKQAAAVPAGFGSISRNVSFPLPVPAIYVILAGVAATVVATVAVYRYLDPTARIAIAATDAASKAYAGRLATADVTGIMPPPSPVELANEKMISDLAKQAAGEGWKWAGIGVGGTIAAGLGLAAIKRALA